jgi:polygalacturonase
MNEIHPSSHLRRHLAATALAALGLAGPAVAFAAHCSPWGAAPDGVTDNTAALQAAIDNCAATGGGIVRLAAAGGSANVYLTTPIRLRSHVLLEIDKGVTLQGTNDESAYTPGFIDYPYRLAAPYEALVSAYQAAGVGIIGEGTIDGAGNQLQPGGGPSWWTQAGSFAASHKGVTNPSTGIAYYSAPYADVPTSNGMPRPWLVEFYQCDGIRVSGVTLQNSPMWHLVFRWSSHASVTGVTVSAPGTAPNTDAIDIVGSTDVVVADVHLSVGDDDVAIKSGLPLDAEIPNDPAEVGLPVHATAHVLVTDAVLGTGHGISIGSEAAYGVHDVAIRNVTWNGTSDGFRVKTGRDRGSQIHAISLSNLVMTNVPLPLSIQAFYPGSAAPSPDEAPITPTATTPYVHDITISGLTATGATSQSVIEGLPESCMLRVNLRDVSITTSNKGLGLENMTGTFDNVVITPSNGPATPFVVNENVTVVKAGTTPAFADAPAITAVPCASQPQQQQQQQQRHRREDAGSAAGPGR